MRTKIPIGAGFPAMYFRKKTSAGRAYLQIVESRREGAAVRQQVIATLGRIEDLQESGQLERLLRSGARFAEKAIVLDALDHGEAATISTRRIGPALAFERVWEETGCRGVIERLAGARKHDFSLERAAFLTVLHRLFCGGSDRAADRWRKDYRIDGVEGLDLHHLYRAMAWLGEELPEDQQDGATPFAPRCVKDVMEEDLFACRRDLLPRSTSCSWTPRASAPFVPFVLMKPRREVDYEAKAVKLAGRRYIVCRNLGAGGDARLQTVVDRGADVPHDQEPARDAADLSQTG